MVTRLFHIVGVQQILGPKPNDHLLLDGLVVTVGDDQDILLSHLLSRILNHLISLRFNILRSLLHSFLLFLFLTIPLFLTLNLIFKTEL